MKIALIVPVYNEKDNIIPFLEQAIAAVEKINISYEIIFVADPSEDGTVELILDRIKYNKNIKLIVMSRRFGQPAALLAGIKNTDADYAVLIDVDLQDPPELIPEMYQQAKLGFDVVMARRNKKIGENFIRKIISSIGYKIISKLSDTNIPENVGEFRLISKKIINNIRSMEERDFF